MPLPTMYTFNAIMTAIETSVITATTDTNVYFTRYAYSQIVTNSNGQIPFTALPVMFVNTINMSVGFYNYAALAFPFVATDYTAATDWYVYSLPT